LKADTWQFIVNVELISHKEKHHYKWLQNVVKLLEMYFYETSSWKSNWSWHCI